MERVGTREWREEVTNDEYLRELAARGDGSLDEWFYAEHVESGPTNGIDGETNGTADDSPLVDELGEITHEVSELMKKQPYAFDVNDVQGSIRLAGRYIDELTAERDEWKAKAEYCKRNDGLPSENDVSANDVDANDANATQDSREKLEAEMDNFGFIMNLESYQLDMIRGWLDRQASITERDVRTYLNREDSELVQAKVDNLQGQIEHLREEIAKRDKGIERLKRQRDEARDGLKNACWEYCETCEHDEQVSRLQRENVQLARDLAECGHEREVYRDACGQLLDLADQMRLVSLDGCGPALVDERGEVVS